MNINQTINIAKKSREEKIPRLRKISLFYEESLKLINKIEKQKRRAEELKNRDLTVRAKHSKKIAKTAKNITNLFNKINQSFLKKEIKEQEGEIFSKALRKALNEGISTIKKPSCTTCHVQKLKALAGTTSEARELLSQLDDKVVLYEEYLEKRKQLNKEIKKTKKEIQKTKQEINEKKELNQLKKEVENQEDIVRLYEKERELIENYNQKRKEYLNQLQNKTTLFLISFSEKNKETSFPQPQEPTQELHEIISKDFPGLTPSQTLQYAGFNQKKLSHYTPQPQKFINTVNKNSKWLLKISKLEETSFLKINENTTKEKTEKILKFIEEKEMIETLKKLSSIKQKINPEKAETLLNKKQALENKNIQNKNPEQRLHQLKNKLSELEQTQTHYFS